MSIARDLDEFIKNSRDNVFIEAEGKPSRLKKFYTEYNEMYSPSINNNTNGIIVLEELEHAKARGAKIYGEIVGYGATGDAYHMTAPCPDGDGAARAIRLAMDEAGITPEQVDYINAHGTSTHHNDLFETRAIRSALGSAADQVVVNSTKSMIGHLLGAAGGVEFIVCVKSIQDGYIHQTMGTKNVDPECDLNYAVGSPVKKDVNYVLTNSLGFGGHNASLLVKKYED